MSIDKDLLDRLMEGRSAGDLFGKEGILAELTKALAERALTTEMEEHLGEERAERAPEGQSQPPNRRNGSSRKTVTTDSGKVVLDIPRDRNGTFDPLLIAKYQRRFPEFGRKIVSMYARGMTTREIQGHIEEIYGFEASPSLISAITEAVMDEVNAWQNRPLEPCCPVVFMDAIRVNIRSDGAVSNKAVFVALGSLPPLGRLERNRLPGNGWDARRPRPVVPGQRGRQVPGKGAERSAQSNRRENDPPDRFLTLLIRPGHPDCRRRWSQGLCPGHRGGLPENSGPDRHRPSAAPLDELCQVQAASD